MPTYKLSYFDARALAEPARIILSINKIPFEDHRVTVEEWAELKKTTPFGQLPVLYIDGVPIGQSMAITRLLARKFGLAGKNELEEAQIDGIIDQYKDFIYFFRQFTSITFFKEDPAIIANVAKTVVEPARDVYLAILNKILATSKSGFLVGDQLSWADIVIADNLTSLIKNGFLDQEKEKKLMTFYEKIHGIPAIKEFVANRKDLKI